MTGCGIQTQQQLVNNVKIEKVKIPDELLKLDKLEKPIIKNDFDILKAYSDLYYNYKKCEININKIRELNKD